MKSTRGSFSGRLGFILASAGAAVGLGNIWKFPFEVANGGGAVFLLIYLAICFLICWPVMLAEISIGRAGRGDAVACYGRIGHKKWNFMGKMGIATAVIVLSFYNVIAGWAFGYFIEMVRGDLSVGSRFGEVVNDIASVNLYAFSFMLITAVIVSRGVSGGIERASLLLMPILLVIIVFLCIYALTLPHAFEGVSFYLLPDFSYLTPKALYNAVGQAFFSLSLGLGTIVTYGSYLPRSTNIVRSAAFITLADVFIAFLAGFMIFPFVAFLQSGSVEGVAAGPSLIFETLPAVFNSFSPFWGILIGSTFFLLICFAALTSTISLLEIPVAYAVDSLKMKRKNATYFAAFFIFVLGIPSSLSFGDSSYYTSFISYFNSDQVHSFLSFSTHLVDTSMTTVGVLTAIFVSYFWKKEALYAEISHGAPNFRNSFLARYISIMLRYGCPIIIGSVLIIRVLDQFFSVF